MTTNESEQTGRATEENAFAMKRGSFATKGRRASFKAVTGGQAGM
jgi:hypothetical protein